jgi:hypothetical protein
VILDYFVYCWTPMLSTTATPSAVQDSVLHDAVADRVQHCIANRFHMYPLAAAVVSHIRSMTCTSALEPFGPKVSSEAFLHAAIRSLRLYFASLRPEDEVDSQSWSIRWIFTVRNTMHTERMRQSIISLSSTRWSIFLAPHYRKGLNVEISGT